MINQLLKSLVIVATHLNENVTSDTSLDAFRKRTFSITYVGNWYLIATALLEITVSPNMAA